MMNDILETTNILANYPFLEKLVLLVVTLVFAAMQVKKRFKTIDESSKLMAENFSKVGASVQVMGESIDRLTSSLQEHIVQTDLRMSEGEERFKNINFEIEKIKTHVGFK